MKLWKIACLSQENLRLYTMFMNWEKRRSINYHTEPMHTIVQNKWFLSLVWDKSLFKSQFSHCSLGVAEAGFFQELRRKRSYQECQWKLVLMCSGMKDRSRQSIPESKVRQGSSVDRGWLKPPHMGTDACGESGERIAEGLAYSYLKYFKICLINLISFLKALQQLLEPNIYKKLETHQRTFLTTEKRWKVRITPIADTQQWKRSVSLLENTPAFYSSCIFAIDKQNRRSCR